MSNSWCKGPLRQSTIAGFLFFCISYQAIFSSWRPVMRTISCWCKGSCTNCIGTNCIGNKLYRHKLYRHNLYRHNLYRTQIVSGTNCIGHKLYLVTNCIGAQIVSGTNCIGHTNCMSSASFCRIQQIWIGTVSIPNKLKNLKTQLFSRKFRYGVQNTENYYT